jgi:hypothetical protein
MKVVSVHRGWFWVKGPKQWEGNFMLRWIYFIIFLKRFGAILKVLVYINY